MTKINNLERQYSELLFYAGNSLTKSLQENYTPIDAYNALQNAYMYLICFEIKHMSEFLDIPEDRRKYFCNEQLQHMLAHLPKVLANMTENSK